MSQKIIFIKPEKSIVSSVADTLLSAENLENNIVIFPGKRPAHFLRKQLADKKGAHASPNIFSIDVFVDFILERAGLDKSCLSNLDLAAILYEELKEETLEVFGLKDIELDSFLPWVFKLISDFEEIKIELKSERDLSAYDDILPDEFKGDAQLKKLRNFSKLYSKFYKAIAERGLYSRAMKYVEASENIEKADISSFENIIFSGFFAFTAAEKKIIKELSKFDNFKLISNDGPGLKDQLSFLGGEIKTKASKEENNCSLKFYKSSDIHGEVFKLGEIIKEEKQKEQELSKSVIVLPNSNALFPVTQNALRGISNYNISMGYPASATPIYALIDSLAELLDKKINDSYFAPNYLEFVFHPYVKNIYLGSSAETSRIIFQTIEEVLSSGMNKYIELSDIENDSDIIGKAFEKLKDHGAVKIQKEDIKNHISLVHNKLIKPFEKIKDIADFSQKLLDLISFISKESTAHLHAYWAPFVEVAIDNILELKNSSLEVKSFNTISSYFKFFSNFMSSATYPFPGTPLKGLQILGFLETRNLKFDNVYFLDANSDILPASKKEDTVLSHFIRKNLGLSTYKTREKISAYYFHSLIGSAKTAHIFYKDNADKERSPFVEKLIWDLLKKGETSKENDIYFKINFSADNPKPIQKSSSIIDRLKKREFSPSAMDTYLGCGLMFYYKYVLGLSEKDEIADEIDQRDIGSMAHDILEAFFKTKLNTALNITDKDIKAIKTEAEKIFKRYMHNYSTGYEYIIKTQIERRLLDILDYHKAKLTGIKIIDCERDLKTEISAKLGNIKLKGRADRIDERSGKIRVVDYKTGSTAKVPNWKTFDINAREDWHKTLKSFQLPVYVLAYLKNHEGLTANDLDASLMLLGSEEIKEENLFKSINRKIPENKVEIFSNYKKAITMIIDEILDIDKPFSEAQDEKTCSNCPFKIICGR
ncbi:MAG: PD-(D/E)XK nuclease family protein [Elusimicrobiota bacterium]|nr:PD-(D/E)XK nuclease family protein [Elusimicrobiota bacterium]